MHPDDIHETTNYIFESMEIIDSKVPLDVDDFDLEILRIIGYGFRMRDYRDTQNEIETVWGPPQKGGKGGKPIVVLPKVKK